MSDQHGPTPEMYMYISDLKDLSDQFYSQGTLFLILLFSKQLLNPFKLFLVLWWYMMLSITSLSRRDDFPLLTMILHISSLLDSAPSQACFSIQFWSIMATDIWKTQEKVVETACHLFFRPDKQLVSADVTMTPLLYRMRQLIQIFRMNAYSTRKLPQVDWHILRTSPGDDTAWASVPVSRYS